MRTTAVALVTLPVLLGGIGLAAAAVYYSDITSPIAEQPPGHTTHSQTRDAMPEEDAGTAIGGRRPHLTVHEHNRLLLAGSLAGLHSASPIPVPPLPDDAPTLPGSRAAETTVPASAAPTWSVEAAVPEPARPAGHGDSTGPR